MANIPEYRTIFGYALDALENDDLTRRELIDAIIGSFCLSGEELSDHSLDGRQSVLRSTAGVVINDMEAKGIIRRDRSERYCKAEDRIIAIRIEECEQEILRLVKERPMSKQELKASLVGYFKTDTTETQKDDNRLFTYMGQILKELVKDGVFDFDGSKYSIAPEKSAYIKNRSEVLALRTAFLSRIHSRGGEFFEYYFLNLLKKYLTRAGKIVIEGYVTGGSSDGGIDSIVKTVDSLGFRETIMVQTKNRTDIMSETDIRGFYGAVCAKKGSRGIFATTSDFHPMATKLLDSIDDCVGVNGEKLFSMACDTSYGIRREGDKLMIDNEII